MRLPETGKRKYGLEVPPVLKGETNYAMYTVWHYWWALCVGWMTGCSMKERLDVQVQL